MKRYITLSEFQEAYVEALHQLYPYGFADVDEAALNDQNRVVNLYAYKKATEKYTAQEEGVPMGLGRRRYNRAR